jgi:DNA polymerase III gamma/tau subunit
MRDALSLLDQVYSYCRETLNEKEVRTVLGVVDTESYSAIIEAVLKNAPKAALEVVDQVVREGFDLSEFVLGFQEYLRDLLLAKLTPPGSPGALSRQAEGFSEGTMLRMAELVRRTEQELKWSIYPRFLIELMVCKLACMEQSISIEEVLAALKAAGTESGPVLPEKKKLEELPLNFLRPSKPIPVPVQNSVAEKPPAVETKASVNQSSGDYGDEPPAQTAPAQAAPASDASIISLWPKFLEMMMHHRPTLASFLAVAQLAPEGDTIVDIRFPATFKFQFGEVTKKQNREEINKKFTEMAGRELDIHITIEPPQNSNDPKNVSAVTPLRSLDDEIGQEPAIKTILSTFDGEVIG